MDIHMPNMDGYEAARRIRALNMAEAKTVPIIAMTANAFKGDVERCPAVGMNDHICKPVDFDRLQKNRTNICVAPGKARPEHPPCRVFPVYRRRAGHLYRPGRPGPSSCSLHKNVWE